MDSLRVTSNQNGVHTDLIKVVQKHLDHSWHRPLAHHTVSAFEDVSAWVLQRGLPVVLDTGCGTAHSSFALANLYPSCSVVGFDQSEMRLDKAKGRTREIPTNLFLLRADAQDLWRLIVQARWNLQAHYVLYPNPWPLVHHLKRRWHGHPVFPVLCQLGGNLIMRTNWDVYALELQAALQLAGYTAEFRTIVPAQPLTAHEQKYLASGHELYELVSRLTH